jgi:hypothetical protein
MYLLPKMLERGVEILPGPLLEYPQAVMGPALMAILSRNCWSPSATFSISRASSTPVSTWF